MSIEARWIVSTPAAALYLAAQGPSRVPLDGRRIAPLDDAIAALHAQLAAQDAQLAARVWPREAFFAQAIPLAVRYEQPRAWAERCLQRLRGTQDDPGDVDGLERAFRELRAAVDAAKPDLHGELEHRSLPLRELWEARGPGLLAALTRLTDRRLLVDEADVILMLPAAGGGGRAFPTYNALAFEAVLTNPHERLPEVLRLGWLWAQLSLDLPALHGPLSPERAESVGALALLPAILSAAEEVELARNDEETLAAALTLWQAPAAVAGELANWWETYCATRPDWPVALAALAQILDFAQES